MLWVPSPSLISSRWDKTEPWSNVIEFTCTRALQGNMCLSFHCQSSYLVAITMDASVGLPAAEYLASKMFEVCYS
jgi:hypothetical protein